MKLYLTRHGKTEWNIVGKLQGQKDTHLTNEGIENAKRLGLRLVDVPFNKIYSSPLKRAYDTASYIRKESDGPIVVKDFLKEMHFGDWEGVDHSKIREHSPVEYEHFFNKPHLFNATTGEGFNELIDRVSHGLLEIIKESSDTTDSVLIVTHAVVIKAIYSIVEGRTLKNFWNPPYIYDTSLTIIEINGKDMSISLKANTEHLIHKAEH